MLIGFVVSATMKIYIAVKGISVPIYFDPFFVGMGTGLIGLIVGSALTKVSDKEKEERAKLFVRPESENDPVEIKKTKRIMLCSIPLGVVVTVAMLVLWALPYLKGKI